MNKRMNKLHTVAALMALASLQACGGDGSNHPIPVDPPIQPPAPAPAPTPPAPPPAPAPAPATAGIFSVTFVPGLTGTYALLDDGRMYALDWYMGLAGAPWGTLSSGNSTTHTDNVHWADFIDDTNRVGAETSGQFGRTFQGAGVSLSISGSPGSFTATAEGQATWSSTDSRTLYGDPIAPAAAAGTYTGYVRTAGIQKPQATVDSMTLDASGHLVASATGCTFDGTLTPHGTTGIFDMTVTTGGTGCALQPTLAGVAIPLSVTSGHPQFALHLSTADATQTAVFVVTQQ